MMLVRELEVWEIRKIANDHKDYGGHIDEVEFARALFEAARIQQTQERETQNVRTEREA